MPGAPAKKTPQVCGVFYVYSGLFGIIINQSRSHYTLGEQFAGLDASGGAKTISVYESLLLSVPATSISKADWFLS